MTRIGIFLCTCDQKIDKSIDVAAVEGAFRTPDVTITRSPHACLADGQRTLQETIRAQGLERVVVAACAERLLGAKLCDACAEVGLHREHVAVVDWREGCAWAHTGDTPGATAKAIDLVDMGVARATLAQAVYAAPAPVTPRVLVLGGGITGLTAARSLASCGVAVTLVEAAAHVGGQLADVRMDGTERIYAETLQAVQSAPLVEVRVGTHLTAVTGSVGNYRVMLQDAGGALAEVAAGAIVVATGAQEYSASGLYRHDGRRVVTLGEYEAELATRGAVHGPVVYLLCAGGRDEKRVPYCSGTCCVSALQQALRAKRARPDTVVTILFRDLYLLGDEVKQDLVLEARRAGITFARYVPGKPPRVSEEYVDVTDQLTGARARYAYERLVLATPLVPREDAGMLARLLNLPRDSAGFFMEPHRRVRLERRVERGIFVAGSAHKPVDVETSIWQGLTAAARAARFVEAGQVARPAWSARVDEVLCTGCAQCAGACEFNAITLHAAAPLPPASGGGGGMLAHVDPFLCTACGSCVVACPSKAIDLPGASDRQIFAQIDAALAGTADGERRILVFGCAWSGFASMELAGARRLQYPAAVRTIELPCSARLDPLHVLYAYLNGADGVMLALCPPDECHYENGNRRAEERVTHLREQLAANGIDPRRLGLVWMTGDDADGWIRAVNSLVKMTELTREVALCIP
jgi:heterodisulfide reductase subunit A